MSSIMRITNPTPAERALVEAAIPASRRESGPEVSSNGPRPHKQISLTSQPEAPAMSIVLDKFKELGSVVRYNGRADGLKFAFYCPRTMLSEKPGDKLTILLIEE